MRSIVRLTGLLSVAYAVVLLPGAASAQARCPEGRTLTGACVNASLAEVSQQTAIIFAQPKLSYTAYPVLPTGDRLYRYPNELNPDPLKPSGGGPSGGCVSGGSLPPC
jgi:hypothetical protein